MPKRTQFASRDFNGDDNPDLAVAHFYERRRHYSPEQYALALSFVFVAAPTNKTGTGFPAVPVNTFCV